MPETLSSTTEVTDFDITGMTCASCAARIEKKLNRLDGVTATVNLALETARVEHPVGRSARELADVVAGLGYQATPARPVRRPDTDPPQLSRRLAVAAVLTVPTVALGMVPAWQFTGWAWVSLVLATPVVWWAGWPFHRATLINLRHRSSTMDTLVSMGTVAAYLWSLVALVFGTAGEAGMHDGFAFRLTPDAGIGNVYFEAATAVTTFLLAGRLLESRAKRRAGAALRSLLDLRPQQVRVLRDGIEVGIGIEQLRVGDEFVVRPGEKIATDGTVVEGSAAVDTAVMTGESVPVEVVAGDGVVGSTINVNGRLVVRADRVGADTQLARMARRVADAQNGKAQVQRLADRISGIFVPVVMAVAALTFVGWLTTGAGPAAAFTAAVAVLIVACPCALGLATPTALLVGTGRAAQLGILISGPEALERAHRIDTVVLDKTGTITTGQFRLVAVRTMTDLSVEDVVSLAGSAEVGSEHPLGRAIAAHAAAAGSVTAAENFGNHGGLGVLATVAGQEVGVGQLEFARRRDIDIPFRVVDVAEAAAEAGHTPVVVDVDGEVVAVLELADTVRAGAPAMIAALKDMGLAPHLLTGDHQLVARAVGKAIGIAPGNVHAGALPEEKADAVEALQAAGSRVAMVGDGVNDAAALATADLGMAMGGGSDVAIQAADLTLIRTEPAAVVDGIALSRRTLAVIKGNLFWAFAYNIAGIPLAAAGLLNPMIAGAAMAFSSVFVVSNSLRLRRFRVSSSAH